MNGFKETVQYLKTYENQKTLFKKNGKRGMKKVWRGEIKWG